MEAVILAGGLGLRLRRLFPLIPKPMAPVNGEPFLVHLIRYWESQGVRRFILSVGFRAAIIEETLGKRWGRAALCYAKETTPLGTGGAVLNALKKVRSANFLVLNGDTFLAGNLKDLVSVHRERRATATLILRRQAGKKRYGQVVVGADSQILSFASQQSPLIYSGVSLWRKAAFSGFPTDTTMSLESELIPALLTNGGKLIGTLQQVPFVDIGIPSDYRKARAIIDSLENSSHKRSNERHPKAT